jgi:hypothetical protein
MVREGKVLVKENPEELETSHFINSMVVMDAFKFVN